MVEWKKIGDVCDNVIVPMRDRPKVFDGNIPWCRIEDIEGMYFNKSLSGLMVSDSVIKQMNLKVFPTGTVICSCSATLGVCAINTQPLITNQTFIGLVCSNQVNNRYLYYYMLTRKKELFSLSTTGTIPYVSRDKFEKMIIPIPSISEQERIVSILDTFTSSIDNLKQQIAQRRKQYEYYRDQLLDLEGKDDNDIHCWGEFCKMEKGNGVQKVDFVEEGIGCIHYGQIYTHYGPYAYETNKFVSKEVFDKARKASKGDIIMTDTSENVEDICKSVAWLGDDDIAVSNHALIIKHSQNPKFLSYSTQTKSFFLQKRKVVVGVKVSGIKPDDLAKIKIFLPSLREQQRIVSILDTFEASIQNLEAQLSQREKQYEYYRNKLLTFE